MTIHRISPWPITKTSPTRSTRSPPSSQSTGPERYNAFRGKTVEELINAFRAAWAGNRVSAITLTSAGDKALCTGGDVKQRVETGDYGHTNLAMSALEIFVHTDEGMEGARAFAEKRQPDFARYVTA